MTKAPLLDEEELEFRPTIHVNEEYAKRFEHNKRREELHRLQQKHPEVAARLARQAALAAAKAGRKAAGGDDAGDYDDEEEESSSEDDDDEEELLDNDDTDKVLETLVRIKKKDPVVYQKDLVLFPKPQEGDEAAGSDAAANKASKGTKPVYLRTVLAKQALEGGAAASSDDDADDANDGSNDDVPRQPVSHSYAAEQQELKRAFLRAAAEAEQAVQEGLLEKKRGAAVSAEAAGGAGKEQQVNELLDEYFGKDEELTEADAFLKSFLANKAWKEQRDGEAAERPGSRKRLRGMDGDSSSSGEDSEDEQHEEAGADDDEDEQFLEEVDRFEAAYNFRYEEPGSHKIQSFPRVIEDSVRRPDERRQRQRQAKAERKAAEQETREAELRRLKNLKQEEINDMLARIQEEAGIRAPTGAAAASSGKPGKGPGSIKLAGLLDELLEGEFDPEEYDRRMAQAFDDEYYEQAEEAHELFGDADEELADEEDIEAVTDPEAAEGFAALRQKLKQQQQQQDGLEEAEEEEEDAAAAKADKAAAMAQQRSQLQRLLEDYYKLDYEDNIGGLACRFKYREVPSETFGLTDDDILALSDRQLNQIAGLKLLAPYREDAKRLRPNYKALQTIKGEAAAKAALRQQKKDREKWKEKQKKHSKQHAKQQGGEQEEQQQQQQQQQQQNGQAPQKLKHQQQHLKKQKLEQPGGQKGWHGKQQHQRQHIHTQQHQRQQHQKPLAEMTAEEKQAARLASYAKLTLKPGKDVQHQQQGSTTAAAGQHKLEKRKADEQGAEGGQRKQKKQKQGPEPGRLANVQLDAPLTKTQKKNLLRGLRRKEKHQPGQQQ